jgi:hypothetical protein
MQITRMLPLALTLVAALGGGGPALADSDPCEGFKWDVSKERALFASPATPTTAGKAGAAAPAAALDRLVHLQLFPTRQVAFPVTPGKSGSPEGTYAGVLSLNIPASGKYRISIDLPLWVDIAADGKLLPPSDYAGQHGCTAPRKIVVFTLDAKQRLQLQLSDSPQPTVLLTITQVPAG